MKKIVFTLQVLALVAAFPLYVITELNHVSTPLGQTKTSFPEIQKPGSGVSKISAVTTIDFDNQYPLFKAIISSQ